MSQPILYTIHHESSLIKKAPILSPLLKPKKVNIFQKPMIGRLFIHDDPINATKTCQEQYKDTKQQRELNISRKIKN